MRNSEIASIRGSAGEVERGDGSDLGERKTQRFSRIQEGDLEDKFQRFSIKMGEKNLFCQSTVPIFILSSEGSHL